jgi:hypothetical protein
MVTQWENSLICFAPSTKSHKGPGPFWELSWNLAGKISRNICAVGEKDENYRFMLRKCWFNCKRTFS